MLSYPRFNSKNYRSRPLLLVQLTSFVLSARAFASVPNNNIMAILESPSAERNKQPISDTFKQKVYPQLVKDATNCNRDKIKVLELAAGCGVHTTHFVSSFLSEYRDIGIELHPSDPDHEARVSIDARVIQSKLEKSIVPANDWILGLSGGTACNDSRDNGDAGASRSGQVGNVANYEQYHDYFDLATCINMIHISPWEATLGLMQCAGKCLRKGGVLFLYGPYKINGTAVESNQRFDETLRSRHQGWGVRNLEDVIDAAKKEGLTYVERIEMPANNLCVLFCKD